MDVRLNWSGMPWPGISTSLAQLREMLDQRYDDLESGRVKLIDGEEAYRRLMEKTEAPHSPILPKSGTT